MDAQEALKAAQSAQVPLEPIALYARWWQVERWLRDLAYLNLRAAWGSQWKSRLHNQVAHYARGDSLSHLAAPDNAAPIAYLDFGRLLQLIDAEWSLFEPYLPSRVVWAGRAQELATIRKRVGHLRRPHIDDRARLEQALRDLEPGFKQMLDDIDQRHLGQHHTSGEHLVRSFTEDPGFAAARDNVERKYKVDVELWPSRLSWADDAAPGAAGTMWNLEIGGPERMIVLRRWSRLVEELREHVVFAYTASANGVIVSMPAIDGPADLLDPMTRLLEGYGGCTVRSIDYDAEAWELEAPFVDYTVLVHHPLSLLLAAPATSGSVFGA
jgi:hypothetical protein